MTLEADKSYQIDLEGAGTGKGTTANPYLRGIFNTDGVRIEGTKNDNGGSGTNSRVFFTATEDAPHYIAAGALTGHEGTYTLSVEEVL